MTTCPDCAVDIGQPHLDQCDVARCMVCGHQRLSCDCPREPSTWTGVWPGAAEAAAFGFWCIGDGPPGAHWRPVPAGTPGATEDLNRVYRECRWDRDLRRMVMRNKP